MNARAQSRPRIKYSVKCASFLVRKWIVASVSDVVFGKNHRTSGPIMREVFEAENSSVEATDMNTNQRSNGR